MPKREILFFTTRSINPPWDEASKNIAYNLSKDLPNYKIHLLSNKDSDEFLIGSNTILDPVFFGTHFKWKERINMIVRRRRFNAVGIVHFFCNPSPFKTLLVRLATGNRVAFIKTVPTLQTLELDERSLKRSLKADIVVVYSVYTQQQIQKSGIDNVRLIRPGIELNQFKPADPSRNFLKSLGIQKSDFVITYPGEYIRLGDMNTIISAAIEVFKLIPTAKLVFACRIRSAQEQVKKNEIIEKFSDLGLSQNVVFTDTVKDMVQLYNSSDLIIFPAEKMVAAKFVLPLIILEAMA